MRTKQMVSLIILAAILASPSVLGRLMAWLGPVRGAAVGLAVATAVVAMYVGVIGPWQRTWGATDEEVKRTMPGDEMLPPDAASTTRAITIDAPQEAVFPWLLQIEYGRAASTATTGSTTTAI